MFNRNIITSLKNIVATIVAIYLISACSNNNDSKEPEKFESEIARGGFSRANLKRMISGSVMRKSDQQKNPFEERFSPDGKWHARYHQSDVNYYGGTWRIEFKNNQEFICISIDMYNSNVIHMKEVCRKVEYVRSRNSIRVGGLFAKNHMFEMTVEN